ncbi:DUF1015 domain-containing protein [Flavisolibacter ginsenosidimutans]|uniref:DUF1015 domain-containing protein n=1 Tax=Flavisolibacter ginsenosidimutans TaxID=661481 RepID=A0A5B8UMJ3_9BACT|nr:DUF1015 family protein [Flavisolibacter ginsenosidimutans]QEC57225.1 DUF1015 domain-containing protein [Flavisolibacter ginsenosidimutans]
MAHIKPFKALRPHNEYAAQVASRPYDVLNSEEARKEVQGNLLSFLHVTKSEVDLPADVDVHSEAVYQKAKENLDQLIERKVLFQDETPCYYIYELGWKGRTQTGLVCVSSIEDYLADVIKKHEFTRPEKEQDRIDHMRTVRAQTGNVFLACKDNVELSEVFAHRKKSHTADYSFTADDGVSHAIWVVSDVSTIDIITNIFKEKIPFTYIADGHHRAASAAKVSKDLSDSEDAQYFLTTIFPAAELAILDYNRIAKDLNGLSDDEFLQKLNEEFEITKSDAAVRPAELHSFGMYLNGQWYTLKAKEGTYKDDPIGVLDVTVLQNNVLDKILGIKDPRTDSRVDFVGGIRGLTELEKRVKDSDAKVAFSLHPVSLQQLFDIADSGEVMPPKSTWFEPKLRDGLLTHLI